MLEDKEVSCPEIIPIFKSEINGRNVEIFETGHYTIKEYGDDGIQSHGHGGSIFLYKQNIHKELDKLRGQLYNIIEASIQDVGQARALKGLAKGFCNVSEEAVIGHIGYFMKDIGLFDIEPNPWDKE